MSMLTDWIDWALHSKHPSSEPRFEANPEHEMLLACFRSGQMSDAQMQRHMDEDPAFRRYVEELLGVGDESHDAPTAPVREFARHH